MISTIYSFAWDSSVVIKLRIESYFAYRCKESSCSRPIPCNLYLDIKKICLNFLTFPLSKETFKQWSHIHVCMCTHTDTHSCMYLYICGVAVKIPSLTSRQTLHVSNQTSKRSPQNAMTKSKFHVWPKAVVPYAFDHNLSKLRKIMKLEGNQLFILHFFFRLF